MKRLNTILFLAMILPSTALAQMSTRFCMLGTDGLVINAAEMNGAAALRTFTFGTRECEGNVASYNWLIVEMEYTHAKNGAIVMTCETGRTVATADKTPITCTGSGTCTAADGGIVATATLTASKKWAFRLGIRGYRAWSCVATHDDTPGAGNILTSYAYLTD